MTQAHAPPARAVPPPALARSALAQPEALLELLGHSHWVWAAAYSPFHDQLLLTGSSDTTVGVWFVPALAKQTGVPEARAAAAAAAGQRCVPRGRLAAAGPAAALRPSTRPRRP